MSGNHVCGRDPRMSTDEEILKSLPVPSSSRESSVAGLGVVLSESTLGYLET